MKDLKFILKEFASSDDIRLFAYQENWELHDVFQRAETIPLTKISMTSDEQTGIHYFEDFYNCHKNCKKTNF